MDEAGAVAARPVPERKSVRSHGRSLFGEPHAYAPPRDLEDRYVLVQDAWRRLEDLDVAPGEKGILGDLRYASRSSRGTWRCGDLPGQPNEDDDIRFLLIHLDAAERALGYQEKRFWIEERFRDFQNPRNGFAEHQIPSEEVSEKVRLVRNLT